jgi:hypothetical protein
MGWIDDVNLELARALEAERAGNTGKARTSARRAVGYAISELQRRFPQRQYGGDFMRQLRSFSHDTTLPLVVRHAAVRLQSKVATDFTSPSRHPTDDAVTIIEYIRESLA